MKNLVISKSLIETVLSGRLLDFLVYPSGSPFLSEEFRQVGNKKYLITTNIKNQVVKILELEI